MRLSEWQQAAPTAEAMSDRVLSVLRPVLTDLGAESNPECWVVWGEDPDLKYALLAATPAGLIHVAIRLTTPIEGPRATGKLIRWPKVAIGELGLESTSSYRMVAVQVEGIVIKGMDEEADRICAFVRGLIAGTDGRQHQMVPAIFMGGLPGAPMPAAEPRTELPALPPGKVATEPQPESQPESQPEPAPATVPAGDSAAAHRSAAARPAKGGLLQNAAGSRAEPASGPPTPAAPGSPAAPNAEAPAPRPIAARAARASTPEPKSTGKEPPAAPDPEEADQDQARWVGPRPIGDEQASRQEKPRWMP